MHTRHQRGYLRCAKRKNDPAVREFLWRENDANGKRLRGTAVMVNQISKEDESFPLARLDDSLILVAHEELNARPSCVDRGARGARSFEGSRPPSLIC